jgi:hypothetical protein
MHNGNPLLDLIRASVLISIATVALLLIVVLFVRSRNAIYQRRQILLSTRWRNVFTAGFTGALSPTSLPAIRNADWFTVLAIFVEFHDIRENGPGDSGYARLDEIAKRLGIGDYALSLLIEGDDADKVLALNVLGYLRDTRALAPATDLTHEVGSELSRGAAHCALRIDAGAIGDVLQLLLNRDDWARSRVETMLREVEPEALGLAMRNAIAGAPEDTKAHLLDYVRFCPAKSARAICTSVLATSLDPEALSAALRSLAPLATDVDHELAVRYVAHPKDIVALSALRVLRKCVRGEDRDLVVRMLSHADYWIRLRAAEVAVALLGSADAAEKFTEGLADQFSRDAMKQVLAERHTIARAAA